MGGIEATGGAAQRVVGRGAGLSDQGRVFADLRFGSGRGRVPGGDVVWRAGPEALERVIAEDLGRGEVVGELVIGRNPLGA